MFGSITVALTPPPSTVRVMLWPCLITLKYSFLRSAAVCTWNIWSQRRHSAQRTKRTTQHAKHYFTKIMVHIVHCMRHIWYKLCFRSRLHSHQCFHFSNHWQWLGLNTEPFKYWIYGLIVVYWHVISYPHVS
jgi:hypothetical protein